MPRIRTIKPEFWADEKLSPLDPVTRLVFLGLISLADDCGRIVDNLKQIDAFIFPETEDSAREALANLWRIFRIKRGTTASGQKIIQIVNWTTHQKIDHPNFKAALPEIIDSEDDGQIREHVANDSRSDHEEVRTASRPDLRTTINDQRPEPFGATTSVAPSATPVITLPLNDGSEYPIFEEQVRDWRGLYPGTDVNQQLRNMRGWLTSNRSNRKTKSGVLRFVTGWLAREQNKARTEGGNGSGNHRKHNGLDPDRSLDRYTQDLPADAIVYTGE